MLCCIMLCYVLLCRVEWHIVIDIPKTPTAFRLQDQAESRWPA